MSNIEIEAGQVLLFKSGMIGTVKWFGTLPGEEGNFIGCKLGEGTGDTDGKFKGVQYFQTEPGKAAFFSVADVKRQIRGEDLLTKIVSLNKKKKNLEAQISKLSDELNLAKNQAPQKGLAQGSAAPQSDGDSDAEINDFLNHEKKKKWWISLHDLQTRYSSREKDDVSRIFEKHKKDFDQVPAAQGHTRIVYTVASSPRDNMVASGSDDKSIRLWRRENNRLRCTASLQLRSCINSIAFSPTSDIVAAALDSGWIELYDLKKGKMVGALEGQSSSEVWTVAFAPDGSSILSGSLDRAVRVWDLRERECKWALRGHDEWVNGIAVSADGSTIVSGSGDKTVRLWDTRKMECRHTCRGHTDFVRSVCVTGDNKYVVSASDDCYLRVWDFKTGANVRQLKGHQKGIYCVSANQTNHSLIASSSRDATVKVWNVNQEKYVQQFKQHRGDVNSCCWFDSGNFVASCSDDKSVLCFSSKA